MNRGPLRIINAKLALMLCAAGLFIALWAMSLKLLDVSGLVARQPSQVWNYMFSGPESATNRREVIEHVGETLRDFGIGYAAGLLSAFALATGFSLSLTVERIVMPTAMMLRSIPVIVLTPLITLLFGTGIGGITAIVTLVVFLPAMANILYGVRTAQNEYRDLVRVNGGSELMLLYKAALPGSLPAILTSARISVPAAVTGAMIGEWLATGTGVGGFIARSSSSFGYDAMWASAIVITLLTMLVYTGVSIVDTLVQQRFIAA